MPPPAVRACLRDRAGSTAVEFALAIPFVLVALFGTIDVARTYVVGGLLGDALRVVARDNQVLIEPHAAAAFDAAARVRIAARSHGMIDPVQVVIETEVYPTFAALVAGTPIASNAPGGLPNHIVKYRFRYDMAFVTPFAGLLYGPAGYSHVVEMVVQNEPALEGA
jgi:Flp pilus assembly protein TadG